mmetsp:Transcript_25226/g.82821  ORF Transcript_25226/g.82821 Transcript_25226/m.82821 type:complete len:216 (-) Transcript_25226:578-1225(-)
MITLNANGTAKAITNSAKKRASAPPKSASLETAPQKATQAPTKRMAVRPARSSPGDVEIPIAATGKAMRRTDIDGACIAETRVAKQTTYRTIDEKRDMVAACLRCSTLKPSPRLSAQPMNVIEDAIMIVIAILASPVCSVTLRTWENSSGARISTKTALTWWTRRKVWARHFQNRASTMESSRFCVSASTPSLKAFSRTGTSRLAGARAAAGNRA